jgi:hypothetical protein
MSRLRQCLPALGVALGVGLAAPFARAVDAESCAAPKLSVLLPADPHWASATERLTAHLRQLSDLDRCARVTVRPDKTGVVLRISTSDGREAERHVENVEELLTATEALLVLPPPPVKHPAKVSPLELPPSEPKPVKADSMPLRVELGGGGSLRFGGSPLYVAAGVSAFADFVIDRWLLAMSARGDITDRLLGQPAPTDFIMSSAAVGVSAGRRIELGQAWLDALLGANVVVESQDADDADREIHGAAEDLRLGGTVRVSGPRSATIRAFAAGDFEASPSRARSKKYLDRSLPELPWWSSSLTVGVLWGAR